MLVCTSFTSTSKSQTESRGSTPSWVQSIKPYQTLDLCAWILLFWLKLEKDIFLHQKVRPKLDYQKKSFKRWGSKDLCNLQLWSNKKEHILGLNYKKNHLGYRFCSLGERWESLSAIYDSAPTKRGIEPISKWECMHTGFALIKAFHQSLNFTQMLKYSEPSKVVNYIQLNFMEEIHTRRGIIMIQQLLKY